MQASLRNSLPVPKNSSEWIKLFYSYSTTPKNYFVRTQQLSREGDEIIAYNFIKDFAKNRKIALIDLGIGTAREFEYLKTVKNISQVVGIDYSQSMLDFCAKVIKKLPLQFKLIKDDMLTLENSKAVIKQIKTPKIFTIFFGTINNTSYEERITIFNTIKNLIQKEDRLIISFSKLPKNQKISYEHPWIKLKDAKDLNNLFDIQVYIQFEWFWNAAKDLFGVVPQFFYDNESQDIVVTITGVGKCHFSHRFTEDEIRSIIQKTGLTIEKFVEGNEMYQCLIKL